jgi:preprotein translocase subunit SecA
LVFALRTQFIAEHEAALEGLDREHLRIHDNQKLMPLAVLYQAQIETIRSIENQIFAMNSPELAESWAQTESETFEKLRALLLHPNKADGDSMLVTASCAAMLRWCGAEEKCHELLNRWVIDQKDQFESEDAARSYINSFLTNRLKDLYALTDFHDGAQLFLRFALQTQQSQFQAAYETARIFRSFLIHEQQQLQNPPLVKREFYARLIELVEHEIQRIRDRLSIDEPEGVFQNRPYNPEEVRAILDKIKVEEEETLKADEPDDDENASLYERDYETAMDNHGMLFKMLDAFSGNNKTDGLLKEYDLDRRKEMIDNDGSQVGRNDPCPCGSGKKYKMCCLKRQNKG